MQATRYAVIYRQPTPNGPMTGIAQFTQWATAERFIESQLPAVGGEIVKVIFQ